MQRPEAACVSLDPGCTGADATCPDTAASRKRGTMWLPSIHRGTEMRKSCCLGNPVGNSESAGLHQPSALEPAVIRGVSPRQGVFRARTQPAPPPPIPPLHTYILTTWAVTRGGRPGLCCARLGPACVGARGEAHTCDLDELVSAILVGQVLRPPPPPGTDETEMMTSRG